MRTPQQEHIRFSRRRKYPKNRSNVREILSKISLEHIRFSRRKKYDKNRSNFPEELSQDFVRTDTIFQETIPPRTDILQNYLVGCFRRIYVIQEIFLAFSKKMHIRNRLLFLKNLFFFTRKNCFTRFVNKIKLLLNDYLKNVKIKKYYYNISYINFLPFYHQ